MSVNQRNHVNASETKQRLLDAAERLFIEHGYAAMSLRQITTQARANLAAVNYHFGSKEALIHGMLSQRLPRLNQERLTLLSAYEQRSKEPLDCRTLLAILFAPALRIGRDPAQGGPAFMRLLGRIYSDNSRFVHAYLQEHYRPIFNRFFEAFALALPQWSRKELGLRLRFALKSVSGLLAGDDLERLICELSMGENVAEAELLSRLVAMLTASITAPFGDHQDIEKMHALMHQAQIAAQATDLRLARAQAARERPEPVNSLWSQSLYPAP